MALAINQRAFLLLAHLWFVCALLSGPAAADSESPEERYGRLHAQYDSELESLARWCDENELADEATKTRAWMIPQSPLTIVVALPDESSSESIGKAANAQWAERFRKLRDAQGQRLFELAQAAAAKRGFALAFRLAHETLREAPDYEAARRLLGYKRHEDKWLSQYDLKKARAHEEWHEQFGWLPHNDVSRYESGERLFKGRWISADEDVRLHSNIDRGWEVFTEHYQVRTNHSLEEGVRLAAQLEEFYRVWRQVFVRFCTTDEQLARLFRNGSPPGSSARRHQVTCFRNRDEYNEALVREEPNIGISAGFYSGAAPKGTAYFFAGPERDDSTLYHEATHQLFSETKQVREAGKEANFWIIEGIACFMESYTRGNRLVTLGGADALRLKNARTGLLQEGFYLPLTELCGLGMTDLQQRQDDISKLYSEAAGLTYFLLFADEGRYRPALEDYLSVVYDRRDRRDSLANLTSTSYRKLDEQYRKFIEHLP
jgi:hypothetical protein